VTAVYHLRVCWSCNIVNKTTKLKTKTKTKTKSLKTLDQDQDRKIRS